MAHWKVSSVYKDMFYGDAGMELDPRIADPSDFHFIKGAPSIFFGTPLQTFLTRQGVDTVIVTGCTTSGCVRASIVDAFSYGYRVMVPESCCGDQEMAAHQANLADVGRRYADVLGLEEVIQAISGKRNDA
jgi:maleamate amidohydrolase